MKFGFSLIMRGNSATPEAFEKLAERAEALDLDSLWCSDHLIVPRDVESKYVGRADGKFPESWRERYWEPFTVLGYLAACTKKIQLGTSVLILPMRNPIEVAAMIADLDQLSGGRIVFGVGVGWFREEFEVLNWPFRERGARTNEGLAICKTLWSDDSPRFDGRFYRFGESDFGPKPVQKPHPPIWIAGNSPAALRRVAKYGDGWHPFKPSLAALEQGKQELAGYLEAEGRRMEDIVISAKGHLTFTDSAPGAGQWPLEGRVEDIVAGIKRFGELGVEHFILDYLPETLDKGLDAMERFAQEIRPKL